MEGSANTPEGGKKSTTKFLVIGIVAILILVAVAAVVLSSNGDDEEETTNYLDEGFKLELFYNQGNSARQLACEILKENLEALNPGKITITVTGVEWSTYLSMRKTGQMPAFFLGWAPDYADPDDYVQPFYYSGGTYAHMIGYANETLDTKIAEAAAEVDATARAEMYYDISVDMYEECCYIYAAQATNFHVQNDWIDGYYFNPMFSNLYYYSFTENASHAGDNDPTTFTTGEIDGNPEYFDPAIDYETAGGEVLQNVYETLIWYNGTSPDSFVPQLCTEVPTFENGLITADGLHYTFNLRSNVKFHDGTTMDAYDVKYSLERALKLNDPNGPIWMQGQVLIEDYYNYGAGTFATNGTLETDISDEMIDSAIWVKDSMTIQFNLTQAYPAFLSTLAFNVASVVSMEFVEAHGGMTEDGYTYMNEHMCGTGAYTFEEYEPSDYILLERFDDYWQGPAYFETVILKQVADDAVRIEMLKAGDLDTAYVPRALITSVEKADGTPQSGLEITKGIATLNVEFVGLNQNINVSALNPDYTNVPSDFFADINVRKAFAYAFNDALYIEQGLKGTAIQPNSAIPYGMFGYNASVPVYPMNTTLAKQYLEAALLPESVDSESSLADIFVARLEN
ncbi:MAG: ABC transporter substrate-binding protein [Methanomassiliicoccales archaeon]|jgi:ABC-type transport system substrate-binding protein